MRKKLLCILGPTSTGKTDLAIILAKKFNGEIISADSRQVYKYLDIGTGKMPSNGIGIKGQVSREDGYWIIDGVKIWMYDVINPDKRYNLYQYILKAEKVIKKITDFGKLPIVVGGTGLYVRSLTNGLSDFGSEENKKLRLTLEELDINEIKNKISKINPDILKQLNFSEINNKRRLIRLLEKLTTGSSKKSFPGLEKEFNILKIGLKAERKVLREKIRQRVLSRIDQGMVEESKKLLAKGILTYERMEELGLEYKYIARFLKREIKTLEEFIDILSLKIGQFAKRQMTWFKKEKQVLWFDVSSDNFASEVEKKVLDWYNSSS